mgnify:CR=1 FL=1|jgi:hypothetical protein
MYRSMTNKTYPWLLFDGFSCLFTCSRCGGSEYLYSSDTDDSTYFPEENIFRSEKAKKKASLFRSAHSKCKEKVT